MDMINPINALYGDLASVKTLADVINLSIAFDKPVKTHDELDKDKKTSETLGNYSKELERKYGGQNGIITFYYNGVQYEIYATNQVERVLLANNFTEDPSIGSILGGGRVPTDFEDFWNKQRQESNCIFQNSLLSQRKVAIESSIRTASCTPISEELIQNRCFKVPTEGYMYVYESNPPKLRKPIKDKGDIYSIIRMMNTLVGKMSKHVLGGGYSEQRTFVYLDGNVYVTESEEVISQLKKHGFVESDDVENLGLGWRESMVDPYYADRYSRVMMSDEKYKLIEQKSHDQRKIGYLEEQNTTLQDQNNQFIDSIAMSYRRYTENAKKNGEEPISLKAFIIDILGLELPDEIIDKIPTK